MSQKALQSGGSSGEGDGEDKSEMIHLSENPDVQGSAKRSVNFVKQQLPGLACCC